MAVEQARVVAHYEVIREEDRLGSGLGVLELERTREILHRFLPPAPASILDVGGGTGVHAEWLLRDGYAVHLVDLTPRHVEVALRELSGAGLTASVGDARRLDLPDDTFDAVLLFGPLYHLQSRSDRVATIREARRLLKLRGTLAAAAISRFASLFDGLARGFIFDSRFYDIVHEDLATGRHVNPDSHPHWFTDAFFHRPDELRDELSDAGMSNIEILGVEGLAGWLPHLEARCADPAELATLLETARLVESDPALSGLSSHLLAVSTRQS